jgi:hypothetical protein
VIWAPKRATCITSRSASTIDFFILGTTTAQIVDKVEVLTDTGTAPHRPLQLVVKHSFQSLRKQVIMTPQQLLKEVQERT